MPNGPIRTKASGPTACVVKINSNMKKLVVNITVCASLADNDMRVVVASCTFTMGALKNSMQNWFDERAGYALLRAPEQD